MASPKAINTPEETSTSRTARACMREFEQCIEHMEGPQKTAFETRLADFRLWVENVGATAQAKGSLEWRFQDRPEDIRIIQGLLLMFEGLLHTCSGAVENEQGFSSLIISIDATIDSLAFIGTQIRRSGRKSRLNKVDECFDQKRHEYSDLRAHLACILTAKPTETGRPKEDAQLNQSIDHFLNISLPPIQERLVEANLRRRHRFMEAQRHAWGLKMASAIDSAAMANKSNPTAALRPDDLAYVSKQAQDRSTTLPVHGMPDGTIPATSTSGIDSDFVGLTFETKPASTVTRITKITAAAKYPKVRIPENTGRKLFLCPCCCQALPLPELEKERWRKHLSNDLYPYTCVAPNCPTPHALFVTKSEWDEHVFNDHASLWQCLLCRGDPPRFALLSEFLDHTMKEHSSSTSDLERLLSEAQIKVLGITQCPLCDSTGPEDSPDLVQHVLQHVHDFSIRALPWPSDPDVRINRSVGTIDMSYAVKIVHDSHGNEFAFDIAGWAETTDHLNGLGDDFLQASAINDTRADKGIDDSIPTLQLCDFDLKSPSFDGEGSRATDIRFFSQNEYFDDVSSDGNFSSQGSEASSGFQDVDERQNKMVSRQWICTLCSLPNDQGDNAFFEHLTSYHEGEIEGQKLLNRDIERWGRAMLADAYWHGLRAIVTFESAKTQALVLYKPLATYVPKSPISDSADKPGSDYTSLTRSGVAYVFRIDEFREHPDSMPQVDERGKWLPSSIQGYNLRVPGGVSGMWWFCNGSDIRSISGWQPTTTQESPYKVFSTIYGGGHGFYIMRGDATSPPTAEAWHDLWFDCDESTYTSHLTNAGSHRTLQVQNSEKGWPQMLLPDIYHGAHYPQDGYGGLGGDLAIFLALVAFSMKPERLLSELPKMMDEGTWQVHARSHGRVDKRGVIVYIYPYNNNIAELAALENGDFGTYYK